ncbi:hypothetical protein WAK64_18935 [Bacillus spongiae]|uniref:Yip1 domain-containing protein n=1 Tax=Bacillus spongiae TaxID=2683610 RepID=A0ABU8HIB0_9BACI
MELKINLWRGIRKPSSYFYQLRESESTRGLLFYTVLLIYLSSVIYGVNAAFGIGTDILSDKLISTTLYQYAALHSYFIIGSLLAGLLFALSFLLLPSLFFWSVTEESYKKIVHIQLIALIPLLLENITFLPLMSFMGLEWMYSPLSLGIIAQEAFQQDVLVSFAGGISLFKVWSIYLQFRGLSWLSDRKPALLLFYLILIQLLFIGISVFLEYIDFSLIL